MVRRSWLEAVEAAVRRYVALQGSPTFSRQELIESELDRIVSETRSVGDTPHQTLSRELQGLRDRGLIAFDGTGVYRWLGDQDARRIGTSKGVFVISYIKVSYTHLTLQTN